MGDNFKRFKSKAFTIRLVKSILAAIAAGLLTSGVLMLLWKLEVVDFWQWLTVIIGAATMPLVWLVAFLLLGRTDMSLAKSLDADFGLDERIQTMVEYRGMEGDIYLMQRVDAERALGEVPISKFKAKYIWIYILVTVICAAVLAVSFVVPDGREYEPPEQIVPFELSAMQEAALSDLIDFVDSSDMQEPYKGVISDELTSLLQNLKAADTEPEMHAALATSLTVITEATYDSSSMTEILNALWRTGNEQLKMLAKALDTSTLPEASWGDFAEIYDELIRSFDLVALHTAENPDTPLDEAELLTRIKWMVEDISIKTGSALTSSGIAEEDILYAAIDKMINADVGEISGEHIFGFAKLTAMSSGMDYDALYAEAHNTLDAMTDELFEVVSIQKTNTNVGEAVLKKLSSLFMVAIPQFERPVLKDSGSAGDGPNDDGSGSGGGVGEGVEFGSDDLVLDPLTGEYVTYGTLITRYNTLKGEKLKDGRYNYTDEQRRVIEEYFKLLFGGLKKD